MDSEENKSGQEERLPKEILYPKDRRYKGTDEMTELFGKELKVIDMGLESFHESLKEQGVEVLHVDWKPPAGGNKRLMEILKKLR